MNDLVAIMDEQNDNLSLQQLIEQLPNPYAIIGDAAYKPTEKLVSIFYGSVCDSSEDNFNYFASQCHIHIEMAFGLMTAKWGLLHRPIKQKLCNVKYYAHSIVRLHNFCIKERLTIGNSECDSYAALFCCR
jgi:hypothetical protein